MVYCYDPKFLDRQVFAESEDADQTTAEGAFLSGTTMFSILSASFGHITLW